MTFFSFVAMITVTKITDLRDLDAAFTIREKVFVGEQNVPADLEYDQNDRLATTRHYLARVDGQPAGAARWRPTANGVKLERFAVLAEFRNQGVGEASSPSGSRCAGRGARCHPGLLACPTARYSALRAHRLPEGRRHV
jgi:GNAT superfamily N-acetyltransferase